MSGFKGDYMGFTYNCVHSSDLGIVRVSDGSRFNENLLPTMQDKTVQVPGGDGTYYFGSYYTQRQFTISFAFDSLTETQLARLKTHFGDKGIHDLIFDECPYKVYSAKVTGTATIKYIPFSEGNTNRVYKGEGSIQFTCYNPFARSRFKYLNKYSNTNFPNRDEWAEASGMLSTQGSFDTIKTAGNNAFPLYNPGDIEADFTFKIKDTNQNVESIKMYIDNEPTKYLQWVPFSLKEADDHIIINSKTNLIEGRNSNGKPTGNVYNEYILDGWFFKIPKTSITSPEDAPKLAFDAISFSPNSSALQYNYYYL